MTKIKSSTCRLSMSLHRIIYLNPTTHILAIQKQTKETIPITRYPPHQTAKKNTKITIFHVKWFFSSPHHLSMTWLNHISIPQLNQQSTHNKTVYIYLLLPFFPLFTVSCMCLFACFISYHENVKKRI